MNIILNGTDPKFADMITNSLPDKTDGLSPDTLEMNYSGNILSASLYIKNYNNFDKFVLWVGYFHIDDGILTLFSSDSQFPATIDESRLRQAVR